MKKCKNHPDRDAVHGRRCLECKNEASKLVMRKVRKSIWQTGKQYGKENTTDNITDPILLKLRDKYRELNLENDVTGSGIKIREEHFEYTAIPTHKSNYMLTQYPFR